MIWHLLSLPDWRSAIEAGRLRPPGEPGSFLHASPDEVTALAVANAFFRECAEPLVALGLDEPRLSAPVRYEPADPAPVPGVPPGTLFPHVYGPVPTGEVREIRYARRDPSGRYTGLEQRPGTAEALDLLPHPEGGWFRQTWEAGPSFEPPGYRGERAAATAIYFLLPPGAESCWHRVRSDELWLWHSGGPLTLVLGGSGAQPGRPGQPGQRPGDPGAQPGGERKREASQHATVVLGPDLGSGQRPQYVVPGGCWQAARPSGPEEALVTCVVAPGFAFADFEAAPGP